MFFRLFLFLMLSIISMSVIAQEDEPPVITRENADQLAVNHQFGNGRILHIAWHPDNVHFAVLGEQALWVQSAVDADDAQEIELPDDHKGVLVAGYNDQAELLVVLRLDEGIRLINTTTGQSADYEVPRIAEVFGLATVLSPEGDSVAVSIVTEDEESFLYLWDIASGMLRYDLEQENPSVVQYAVGNFLGGITREGQIIYHRLWNLEDGSVFDFPTPLTSQNAMSIAYPLVAFVSTDDSSIIEIWNLETQNFESQFDVDFYVSSVTFAPENKLLIRSDSITLRSMTGEILQTYDEALRGIRFKFNDDGSRFTVAGFTGSVWAVETSSGRKINTLDNFFAQLSDLRFHSDRNLLAFWNGTDILLYDVDTRIIETRLSSTFFPYFEFLDDGELFINTEINGSVAIWGMETTVRQMLDVMEEDVREIHISPDEELFAAVKFDELVIWNFAAEKVIASWQNPGESSIVDIEWSPDGTRLLMSDVEGVAYLWDIEANETLLTVGEGVNLEWKDAFVEYNPDGERFILADEESVQLWDAETLELIDRRSLREGASTTLVPTLDKQHVLVGTESGKVLLFDTTTGELIYSTDEDDTTTDDRVSSIALSPDGELFTVGGLSGVVRIYDLDDGTLLGTVQGYERGSVWVMAFSPDGTTLVTSDFDNVLRFWTVGGH